MHSLRCSYRFSDLDGKDGEIVIGLIGTEANAGRWNYPYVYGDYHLLVRSVEIEPENLLSIPQAYEQYNLLVMTASAVEQLSDAQKESAAGYTREGACFWPEAARHRSRLDSAMVPGRKARRLQTMRMSTAMRKTAEDCGL